MRTGNRNPFQVPTSEQYDGLSTQHFSGKSFYFQNKLIFPALNSANNFATIDYEAQINSKLDYPFNHVFETMSVSELSMLFVKSNELTF